MCELLVGLPEVTVLDVTDIGNRLRVTVETERNDRRVRGCEASVVVKDQVVVELTDLPFGSPAVLAWRISVHRPRSHAGLIGPQIPESAPSATKNSCPKLSDVSR